MVKISVIFTLELSPKRPFSLMLTLAKAISPLSTSGRIPASAFDRRFTFVAETCGLPGHP